MHIPDRSQAPTALYCISRTLLSLVLLASPAPVLAGGGHSHGNEFQSDTEASQSTSPIQVDAETAKRLAIKVEQVKRQQLAVGIKTTGQIETQPNQKVEVNAPITGTVVQLLVKPGDRVSKGQSVAVLSSAELAQLRVESVQNRADAEPELQQAQADLRLAQQNYERQQTLVAAEIQKAQSQVAYAQARYKSYKYLADAGALERLLAEENVSKLAEAKATLAQAQSRLPVLDAQAQLKRTQAAVAAAQSRIRLSSEAYQARLQQLGNNANAKGLVTVTAPISGTVADREISIGESVTLEAGSKSLMTIVNDSRVFATANVYEKDLDKVEKGQRVNVKVASLPDRTFTGRIAVIGSVVEGEARVVPVKAELDNSGGVLKPGMFAQLEVLTGRTPTTLIAIPISAIVEANKKQLVYVKNGTAYQPVEVTLGQMSGDMVEVKSGLFEGDLIITQRAPQLYAQALKGGSKPEAEGDEHGAEEDEHGAEEDGEEHSAEEATSSAKSGLPLPFWLMVPVGGAVLAATFWLGRRTQPRLVTADEGSEKTLSAMYLSNGSTTQGEFDQTHKAPSEIENNHHEPKTRIGKQKSGSHHSDS